MKTDALEYVSRLLSLVGDDDPMEILSSTPARVAQLVATTDRRAHALKPSPSAWSINEVAAHLADAEVVAAFRLRLIAAAPGAPLQAFDQDRWASTFDYASSDAVESARLFAAFRMGTLRMLRTLSPATMDNYGVHDERGQETIRHLIRLYAGHDRNHLGQLERLVAGVAAPPAFTPAPIGAEVPLDVARSVDLRVGTILDVVPVPDSDRLVKLIVDFGDGRRAVVAGIRKERADPVALVGRQALFYVNVPRVSIRGERSEAMLCDVGYADGVCPALLEPEWPVPNGVRAG